MMSLLGILISLGLLMYLAYRGFSVILLAPVLAMLAVLLSGMGGQMLGVYTQVFMKGLGGYVVSFFPLFLLGAVFGKLMDDSGSARTIAAVLISKLGNQQAVLSIVLACGILTYGGVSLFVVGFAVFPIAAALFRELDIPKRLIPGAIVLGALTFTMTAFPGSPAIQNAIPMPFFNTDAFAAPGLGIIAGLVMLVGGMWWMNRRAAKARLAGETYGKHSDATSSVEHDDDPGVVVALLPIILVIGINFLCAKWLLPGLDTSYLATDLFGNIPPSRVIGTWAIVTALVASCLMIIVLNWKRWKNLQESMSQGALGALLPIFNTASEVGYGSVIAILAGFAIVKEFLLGLAPGNPLISEAVFVNVMAGITGSASGGMSIALNTMGETYLGLATQFGINPELMHRVASIASGGLDSLPHNGAVISLLTICSLTHRESYKDIFVVAVAVPLVALIVVIALGTMFGSF
ncbi:H+/gluconate symporter-like permease [Thiopseudomonas denitrificans]|uniref:H+/gluconate symporter-like permease n=2 Tax=Thiopseudomonas denitrificans TaxID=1501432 RepID=A0A4R6TRW6_9GAMM|nr:H+/gluconate symporter-like permease [Thiopseudomonas denitrificans]